MIPLSIQFSLILFSLGFGILFWLLFQLVKKWLYCQNTFFRIINTFSFILANTFCYFVGIEYVSDGILHIYSLLLVFVSFSTCDMIARRIKK